MSQITSLTIVYSAVYSGEDQRKHQSSASLAFVRGIHRGPVNSPHKWPVTRKMFPFDDVIMIIVPIRMNKLVICIIHCSACQSIVALWRHVWWNIFVNMRTSQYPIQRWLTDNRFQHNKWRYIHTHTHTYIYIYIYIYIYSSALLSWCFDDISTHTVASNRYMAPFFSVPSSFPFHNR